MSSEKLEARDLVRLIKACRDSGVSNLKLGDLEIKFNTGDAGRTLASADETVEPTDQELKEIEEHVTAQSQLDRADDELAMMQVDDPSQFEELLVQRELEPSGDGNTEDFA